MAGRDRIEHKTARVRDEAVASQALARKAVERAQRVAEEAIARRRLLQARAHRDAGGNSDGAIWDAAARALAESAQEHHRQLGVLAHELRQPLAAAVAAQRVVAVSQEPHALERANAVLDRQLQHLTNLIESLLHYSRAGLFDTRRTTLVDVALLIEVVVETLDVAARARKQTVAVRLGAPSLPVLGDALQLRQALANLLQNAIRYTPLGGQIEIRAAREADSVVIAVEDNGEGIDPARVESIFQPFVRLSAAGTGLGIGLTLARRVAELHGGTIVAASNGPGAGSVFTLTLPVGVR